MSATKHIKLFDMSRAAELIDDNPDTRVLMEHYIFEAMSSASTWSAGDRLKPWTPTAEMLVPAALKRGVEALHERTVSGAVQGYDWIQVLKPDQRLHRDELARWCAVMGVESDEFVLPAPVGLKTADIATCLADIGRNGLTEEIIKRRLKINAGWLGDARVVEGKQGGASALWNPAKVALAMVRRGHGTIIQMRGEFERNPMLRDFLKEFERMAESLD